MVVTGHRRAVNAGILGMLLPAALSPTSARVDGIPFYAPVSGAGLPDEGFESLLPRVEAIKSSIPMLREAAASGEWEQILTAQTPSIIDGQLRTLGSMASILGDEAYTALSLKSQYATAARRLMAVASEPAERSTTRALATVDELDLCISKTLGLVPEVVVKQVKVFQEQQATLNTSPNTRTSERLQAVPD